MTIKRGTITIVDYNDIEVGAVAPSSPALNQMWLDTSEKPNVMKSWTGTKWETVNDWAEEVDSVKKKVETNSTDIKAANGKISTLIQNTTIEKDGAQTSLKDAYSSLQQEVSSISQNVTNMESDINEELKTLTQKVSSAESKITEDAIKNVVKKSFYTKDDIDDKGYATSTEVSQVANGLQIAVNEAGGYNMYLNTALKNGFSFFEKSGSANSITIDTSKLDPNGNYSMLYDIHGLTTDTWTRCYPQKVEIIPGETYTTSAYIFVPEDHNIDKGATLLFEWFNAAGTRISMKSVDVTAKTNEWVQYSITQKMPETAVCVTSRLTINRNGKAWIGSLTLSKGSHIVPWSSNPNEVYSGVTSIDKNGVTVNASNVKSKTQMSANGFKITNTEKNEDVFSVNANGELFFKGKVEIVGGKVPTSALSGTIGEDHLDENLTNAIQKVEETIVSVDVEYAISTSSTTAPTTGWQTTPPTWQNGKFIWSRTITTYMDGTTEKTQPVCITGATGATGPQGPQGNTGATGNGIASIVEYYLVSTTNSGVTTSTSGWSTSVPTMTTTNKYLWCYEKITYTNGSSSMTTPKVIGVYGNTGATGPTGATGNGIKSITNYYLATSAGSGVTVSTSGWTTNVQTMTATNRYLWNYEKITYTNGSTTNTGVAIIGVYGQTGNTGAQGPQGPTGPTGATGTGIQSVTEEYYLSTSKTTQTGGSWTTTPPTWSNGKYLWTRSKIVYKNPTSTEYTTPVCDNSWEAVNEVSSMVENGKVNWNNAYDRVKQWASGAVTGSTTINGGMIATNTITANQIAIGDFSNYAVASKNSTCLNQAGATVESYNLKSSFNHVGLTNRLYDVKAGDKFLVKGTIYCPTSAAGKVNFDLAWRDASGTHLGGSSNGVTGVANGYKDFTLEITASTKPSKAQYAQMKIYCENAEPHIIGLEIRKKNSGELIVDGAITAEKIHSNAITSDKLHANAINGKNITGCTITGGTFEATANSNTASKKVKTTMKNGKILMDRSTSNVNDSTYTLIEDNRIVLGSHKNGNWNGIGFSTSNGYGYVSRFVSAVTSTSDGDWYTEPTENRMLWISSNNDIEGMGRTNLIDMNKFAGKALAISGASNLSGALTVGGTTTLNGTTNTKALNASGAISTTGGLTVGGLATIKGGMAITGTTKTSGSVNFTLDTNGNAKIGYYTTDKCTYIANGSNNWLRLCDNGDITWKGKNVHYADQAIYVNEVYSKGNSSGNFHIVNNGATASAGSTFIRAGVDLRIKDKASDNYVPVVASKFTVSSEEKWKENIEEVTAKATDIINNTTVYEYDLKAEGSNNKNYGLIIDRDAPNEVINEVVNEDGSVDKVIDLYGMTALAWKSLQEHQEEKTSLEMDVCDLLMEIADKEKTIEEQNAKIASLEADFAELLLLVASK